MAKKRKEPRERPGRGRGNTVVHGRVFDLESGEPLANHRVRVFSVFSRREGSHIAQARTSRDGSFTARYRDTALAREAREGFPDKGPGLVLRIYDPRDEHVHTTEERSGPDRFERWDIGVLLPQRDKDALLVREGLEEAIKTFFARPEVLQAVSRILSEEGGMEAKEVYARLSGVDPFLGNPSPLTFRTTVCCVLNRLLDDFKQTPLGSAIGLGGNTYKHLGSVQRMLGLSQLEGIVLGPWRDGSWSRPGVEGRIEVDQDFNFNVLPTNITYAQIVFAVANTNRIPSREINELLNTMTDGSMDYFWRVHCEITPCDQTGNMRRFMSQIRVLTQQADDARANGQPWAPVRVALQGEITFDGTHLSYPAHLEVHDVKDALVLPAGTPSLTPTLPQP